MNEALDGWIDTRRAAELTGYTREYIAALCRGEKVKAQKIGRDWLVDRESILEYQANVRPGRPKDNATE